jgi:hypothetical protein
MKKRDLNIVAQPNRNVFDSRCMKQFDFDAVRPPSLHLPFPFPRTKSQSENYNVVIRYPVARHRSKIKERITLPAHQPPPSYLPALVHFRQFSLSNPARFSTRTARFQDFFRDFLERDIAAQGLHQYISYRLPAHQCLPQPQIIHFEFRFRFLSVRDLQQRLLRRAFYFPRLRSRLQRAKLVLFCAGDRYVDESEGLL